MINQCNTVLQCSLAHYDFELLHEDQSGIFQLFLIKQQQKKQQQQAIAWSRIRAGKYIAISSPPVIPPASYYSLLLLATTKSTCCQFHAPAEYE
jgi:hypothetical protein